VTGNTSDSFPFHAEKTFLPPLFDRAAARHLSLSFSPRLRRAGREWHDYFFARISARDSIMWRTSHPPLPPWLVLLPIRRILTPIRAFFCGRISWRTTCSVLSPLLSESLPLSITTTVSFERLRFPSFFTPLRTAWVLTRNVPLFFSPPRGELSGVPGVSLSFFFPLPELYVG